MFRRVFAVLAMAAALVLVQPDTPFAKQKKSQPGQSIVWGERIDLTPPEGGMGRYPRLVRITKGAARGDLLLCYQTGKTGGDFWLYRSRDLARSWEGPVKVNKATPKWNFASCNIIQLDDGRLMMSMLRRARGSNLGRDYFIDVRFSSDGGVNWSERQQVFQGANWEGRAIQVPNDANGDGHNDIYLFFTQRAIPTNVPEDQASRSDDYGRAVAWIASYDNGKSWTDPNPERFTARIVHRNFDEKAGSAPSDDSGGGMPTPFILNGNRIGFVAEQIDMRISPFVVVGAKNDWDWENPAFSGPWTSADYDGLNDERVYPDNPRFAWPMNNKEFGGAPYASVLPDGRVVVAVNSRKRINVWVGDRGARNFVEQKRPFDGGPSFYAFIEPISETEVLVGAGPPEDPGAFIYLRRGRIVD
jgi:hypothetical protein